jgi:thiamine biosynthesis lipoprotein
MGTRASVTVYGLDEERSRAVAEEVFAEWGRIEGVFSWHDPKSSLSALNRSALREWTPVSEELWGLLEKAQEYHRLTGGAFDATFSPVWELWKVCAKQGRMPSSLELSAARAKTGWKSVRLDSVRRMVRFDDPVSINLGGTVKDYALRRGLAILERSLPQKPAVLLDLGGDLLAWGAKSPAWTAGIKHPLRPAGLLGMLRLSQGGAVLTSGSYERFVEIDGRRFCHILDSRTGRPLEGMSSFTLALPDPSVEHLPSVAAVLLGRERALEIARSLPGALAVWADADGRVETSSGPGAGAAWVPSGD